MIIQKQNQLWIIDIDGTIVNVHSNQVPAWLNMFKDVYGVTMDEETLVSFFGKPFRSVLVNSLAHAGLSEEEILAKYDQAFEGYVRGVQEGLERNGGKILPGGIEFLKYLGELNIPRAVATGNPEEEGMHKLKYFGLVKYYDITIFAENRREREELVKDAVKTAEKKYSLKLRPKDIKIVGDSPHDIQSAKSFGFVSVGVSTGPTPYEKLERMKPDYLFKSLGDYKKIINRILEETK